MFFDNVRRDKITQSSLADTLLNYVECHKYKSLYFGPEIGLYLVSPFT